MNENRQGFLWLDTRKEQGEMHLVIRYVNALTEEVWGRKSVRLRLFHINGSLLLDQEKEWKSHQEEMTFACPKVTYWDCEHPVLYEAEASLMTEGTVILKKECRIGFRDLKRDGNQIFWNDRPLKLKGICYRERPESPGQRLMDLKLFKQANINYIRSIYGNFSKEMLTLCDEMGFLVENTAPFYGIGTDKPAVQDLPHVLADFLKPLDLMLQEGCHVSILIWSLGHDCAWGSNFREMQLRIRSVDSIRPVTFHLPMSIPEEEEQPDVWPVHFIDYRQPFDQCYDQMVIFHTQGADNEIGYMTGCAREYEMPVLHEVWSPVACHNREETEADPAIREFWGNSIIRFVNKAYETQGCLGGAVLAGVDEDGSFEDMGKYEWGILNTGHQPKPEYHHVKMAYSPIFIKAVEETEKELVMVIENRFLHSDLNEVQPYIDSHKYSSSLQGGPGTTASFRIAMEDLDHQEEAVRIEFRSKDNEHVYRKYMWKKPYKGSDTYTGCKEEPQTAFQIREEDQSVWVENGIYSYEFSRETGLLRQGTVKGKNILAGGPFLCCTRLLKGKWMKESLQAEFAGRDQKTVRVTILGSYENTMDVCFRLTIGADGMLKTTYEIIKLYRHMPHTVKAGIGLDKGGINEKGVTYLLADHMKTLSWKRKGLWTSYPEDHMSRPEGTVILQASDEKSVREFYSSRHHITMAQAAAEDGSGIRVISDGSDSVRLRESARRVKILPESELQKGNYVIPDDVTVTFQGNWVEMEDYCGNYMGTEVLSKEAGSSMTLTFKGNGIRLYGPLDIPYGTCDIYLDGELQAEGVSQYPDKVYFPGMSRGYEKRYRCLLFEANGLPEGNHTLKVVVRGDGNESAVSQHAVLHKAQNTYTALDYVQLYGAGHPQQTRLTVNQDYNYARLVRGCYTRPKVVFTPGIQEGFRMYLMAPGQIEGGALQ